MINENGRAFLRHHRPIEINVVVGGRRFEDNRRVIKFVGHAGATRHYDWRIDEEGCGN